MTRKKRLAIGLIAIVITLVAGCSDSSVEPDQRLSWHYNTDMLPNNCRLCHAPSQEKP